MTEHVHISAIDGIIVMCYVVIGTVTLHLLARRYPNSAAANAILDVLA